MSLRNDDFTQPQEAAAPVDTLPPASGYEAIKNSGRRKLTGIGLGVPVILTLASRSVLAAQCMSNILSGNLSDPDRDSNCSLGWSPGGWGQPGGGIGRYSTTSGAWTAIGFQYGWLDKTLPNCDNGGAKSKATCYKGGSTISNLPSSSLNPDGAPSNMRLADVLNEPGLYQVSRHLICAYFNARLAEVSGGSYHYILTVDQVLALASHDIAPPGGMSINAFLDTTWK